MLGDSVTYGKGDSLLKCEQCDQGGRTSIQDTLRERRYTLPETKYTIKDGPLHPDNNYTALLQVTGKEQWKY